jgi:hypothetical protein
VKGKGHGLSIISVAYGETEEDHEKPQAGYSTSACHIKVETTLIQNMSIGSSAFGNLLSKELLNSRDIVHCRN